MTDSLISRFDIDENAVRRAVCDSLAHADDGELYLEYREGEALVFDNGRLKTGNFNTETGFGLRAVAGEATGYAHASELTGKALSHAADAVSA
ncbi:MAG: metalloprotease TldD, partial [Notoacmeibacter sp.]|nr:metalloprotease TldD [Notoacmeibacter sp.]